jgi:hypothetical protein
MEYNGYGRAIQEIIILAGRREAHQIASALGTEATQDTDQPNLMTIKWHRLSNRRGDDDDVVFDLFMRIGPDIDAQSWQIDWQASDY